VSAPASHARLGLALFGGLLLGLGACAAPPADGRPAQAAPEAAPALEADDQARLVGYFPDTPLVTQDGRPVRFYSDLVRGKRVLIQFLYTRCGET